MSARDGRGTGPKSSTRPLVAFCAAALVGSALAVLAVRYNVLTGRAPAVVRTGEACGALPELATDPSGVPPSGALDAVFGLLPMLPLPDLGPVAPLDFNRYVTPAQYVHFSSVLLAGHTKSAMEADGFRQADSIGYQAGMTFFGAEAIEFASPAHAADFERRHLVGACKAGVAADVRPLTGVSGGVTFVYHDSASPPFRAMFLVGQVVVRLNVCICVENHGDPHVTLEQWARDVDARMRSLP